MPGASRDERSQGCLHGLQEGVVGGSGTIAREGSSDRIIRGRKGIRTAREEDLGGSRWSDGHRVGLICLPSLAPAEPVHFLVGTHGPLQIRIAQIQ